MLTIETITDLKKAAGNIHEDAIKGGDGHIRFKGPIPLNLFLWAVSNQPYCRISVS